MGDQAMERTSALVASSETATTIRVIHVWAREGAFMLARSLSSYYPLIRTCVIRSKGDRSDSHRLEAAKGRAASFWQT